MVNLGIFLCWAGSFDFLRSKEAGPTSYSLYKSADSFSWQNRISLWILVELFILLSQAFFVSNDVDRVKLRIFVPCLRAVSGLPLFSLFLGDIVYWLDVGSSSLPLDILGFGWVCLLPWKFALAACLARFILAWAYAGWGPLLISWPFELFFGMLYLCALKFAMIDIASLLPPKTVASTFPRDLNLVIS